MCTEVSDKFGNEFNKDFFYYFIVTNIILVDVLHDVMMFDKNNKELNRK